MVKNLKPTELRKVYLTLLFLGLFLIGNTILFRSYSETIYALIKGNAELINGIGLDNNNELRIGLLSFSGSTSYFRFEELNNYKRVVVHQSPKRSIYWN
ncbi:MAG: hypothetical protein ACJASM_001625 [Salibacteraceae bacterium]|jgi:hypothetical protein